MLLGPGSRHRYGIITLIDPDFGEGKAHACDNAFHEKAGRSQVGFSAAE
jgi:hypothetical protein